jgi:hypothetical protein
VKAIELKKLRKATMKRQPRVELYEKKSSYAYIGQKSLRSYLDRERYTQVEICRCQRWNHRDT